MGKQLVRKDATISPTGTDDAFPGTFEVILSAPTEDRDGETLLPTEWKTPLPDHITFDRDHAMTVEGTIGSGVPRIDEETGNLIVSGTYSSLPKAQEVRTLVNEGHIRTTSVAFMTEKTAKGSGAAVVRELLNGAFVAIPSNREALVLSSKGVKVGARNSKADADAIQSIHDHALSLGAACGGEKAAGGARVKSLAGSVEAMSERVYRALRAAAGDDSWPWIRGTVPDGAGAGYVVYMDDDGATWKQSFTDDGDTVTLTGEPAPVSVEEVVSGTAADPDEDDGEPAGDDVTPTDGTAKAATPAGNPSDAAEESEGLEAMKKRALLLGLSAQNKLAN